MVGGWGGPHLFILNWVAILSKHSATRDTCVTHLLEHDGEPSSTETCSRQRFTCRAERKTKKKMNRPEPTGLCNATVTKRNTQNNNATNIINTPNQQKLF